VATATENRAEKIRRYIVLDLLDSVIRGGNNVATQDLLEPLDVQEIGTLATESFWELWPEDLDDLEPLDFRLANVQAHLLAADMFDRLAVAAPPVADWYRRWATEELASLQEKEARLNV
jgi:hypothetical protein